MVARGGRDESNVDIGKKELRHCIGQVGWTDMDTHTHTIWAVFDVCDRRGSKNEKCTHYQTGHQNTSPDKAHCNVTFQFPILPLLHLLFANAERKRDASAVVCDAAFPISNVK